MTSETLIELVYLSIAARPFTVTDLRYLLGCSRRNNRAVDVTGLLLHAGGTFLQVIEGPASAVDLLYTRIAADARHGPVVRVFRREVARRSFPTWRMGFDEPQDAMRAELLGFSAVLSAGVGELPPSVATQARAMIDDFIVGGRERAAAPAARASGTQLR